MGEGIMASLAKDFFIGLSNNEFLNKSAKKFGARFGAERFVTGTDFDAVIPVIRELNKKRYLVQWITLASS